MSVKFCIPKNVLYELYLKKQKGRVFSVLEKFGNNFSGQEIINQVKNDTGEVGTFVQKDTDKLTNKTENTEILMAFDLADFYFGLETNPEICFDMRNDFKSESVRSYDNLVSQIESYTDIDCSIKDSEQSFDFQIKRFPQKYLEHNNETVIKYFEEDVFPHYTKNNNMILAVLLQPHPPFSDSDLDFKILNQYLVSIKEKINFSEIIFVFNINNEKLALSRVYPDYVSSTKPLELLSDKYKK